MTPATHVSFDRFEVDLRRHRLLKQGRVIRLQPQPFAVLAVLIERAGETVTRSELHRTLWPSGTHVAFDTSLNTAVRKLRRALGDSADDPRYIETVHGVGYRFIATLAQPGRQPEPATTPGAASVTPAASRMALLRAAALIAVIVSAMLTSSLPPPAAQLSDWSEHARRGRAHQAAGNRTLAAVELARALAAGGDEEALFVDYACALAFLKQPAKALATIERGLVRHPRSATLRATRGLYLHAVGRYDEEMAALTEAVAWDPLSADAHFQLGLGFARRRDYAASLVELQRAVDLSGGAPHFLSWLGRIAADAGARPQAEAALEALRQRIAATPASSALLDAVVYHLDAAARAGRL